MRCNLPIGVVMLALLFPLATFGQASKPDLTAGQGFRIPLPELPPTLFASQINPEIQTGIDVQLPGNYTREATYPLFVWLDGGLGGNGENTAFPRQLIGDEDYIVASFPLFRKPGYDRSSYLDGIIVGMDDYETISQHYQTILSKLNETIPNIDGSRSIIGGHSNGARTVNVLLSAMDEKALTSFRGFFLVDGGFTWSSYCRTSELKDHHILFVVGGGGEDSTSGRKSIVARMQGLQDFAKDRQMHHWRFEIVPGVEHEFAPEYHPIIRDWARAIE